VKERKGEREGGREREKQFVPRRKNKTSVPLYLKRKVPTNHTHSTTPMQYHSRVLAPGEYSGGSNTNVFVAKKKIGRAHV
jgi:hypothetical protein